MIPIDIPPDLASKTIPDLLKLIVSGKISIDFAVGVKQWIKSEWDKKQYGFTPDTETADGLKKVTNSDAYKRMKECIGTSTPYLDVVRLGLLIEDLSYKGGGKEASDLKNNVYKKYGMDGVTILNIGNVGVLVSVIEHMSNQKINNDYSQEYMLDYFMKIIKNWNQISIYHKQDRGTSELTRKINALMDIRYEIFFVFAIGSAGEQAIKTIAKLNTKKTIQKKGYMMHLISRKSDKIGRDHFAWAFDIIDMYSFEKVTLRS